MRNLKIITQAEVVNFKFDQTSKLNFKLPASHRAALRAPDHYARPRVWWTGSCSLRSLMPIRRQSESSWRPIGSDASITAPPSSSESLWRPVGADAPAQAPPPSDSFARGCGVLVLALTLLWTRFLLFPLLLLPLQPPPWPSGVLRIPLAIGASLLFSYLFWLALAFFRAARGRSEQPL